MDINKTPVLKAILGSYDSIDDISETLYHATTKSSAKAIMRDGFKKEKCGLIHGEMECRPNEKTIYLSKFVDGSNLNSNLFDQNEEIVVLQVDPSYLKLDSIYPDDSFYMGIGQEEIFEDVDDIMDEFDIPVSEAKYLLEQTFKMTNETSHEFKCFALWFLKRDGEISVSHDIPKEAIMSIHKHPESPKVKRELDALSM